MIFKKEFTIIKSKKFIQYIPLVLNISLLGLMILTFIAFLARYWWVFEITCHFRLQYFVLLLFFSVIYIIQRKYIVFMLAVIFASINFLYVIQNYSGNPAQCQSQNNKSLRVLMSNVYRKNKDYPKILKLIEKEKPDFFILLEFTNHLQQGIEQIQKEYPYSLLCPQTNAYGIAFFSRLPYRDGNIMFFGEARKPSVVVSYEANDHLLTVIGTHTHSPEGSDSLFFRTDQFNEMSKFINNQKGEVLLIGDLNVTSYSPYFNDFLKQANLFDTRRTCEIHPTWPVYFFPLQIPIDHCLVSDGICITNRRVGSNIDSDHYPLIIDFFIRP